MHNMKVHFVLHIPLAKTTKEFFILKGVDLCDHTKGRTKPKQPYTDSDRT